jgi:hypothetical protein
MAELIISPEWVSDTIKKTYYTHLRLFLNNVRKELGLKEKLFLMHWDKVIGPAIATSEKDKTIAERINYKDIKNYEKKLIKKEIKDDPDKFEEVMLSVLDFISFLPKDYKLTVNKNNKSVIFDSFNIPNLGTRGKKEEFLIFMITDKPEGKNEKIKQAINLMKEYLTNYFKIFKFEDNKSYQIDFNVIKKFIEESFKGKTSEPSDKEIIRKFYEL